MPEECSGGEHQCVVPLWQLLASFDSFLLQILVNELVSDRVSNILGIVISYIFLLILSCGLNRWLEGFGSGGCSEGYTQERKHAGILPGICGCLPAVSLFMHNKMRIW